MAQELTRETCVHKYEECKRSKNGGIPEYDEFIKFADIPKKRLERVFGASAYSKLQMEAGDAPNKLELKRTPAETIMRQYGSLVTEIGVVPPYAEWDHRGLRPTQDGLRKSHNMKWSELPERFVEWVEENKVPGYGRAIEIIKASHRTDALNRESGDQIFLGLIKVIRTWTPARRRNSEGEYKIELRKHLESLRYELNEEFGESRCDLIVRQEYAIEFKKDPNLAEYDRLFGQVARHLQHQRKVIVLILDTRNDKYANFTALVDKYLTGDESLVEVIKK